MVSNSPVDRDMLSAIGWRLLMITAIIWFLVTLVRDLDFYISALLIAAFAILVGIDLLRVVKGRPFVTEKYNSATERSLAAQLDEALAMIDAVAVGLIALDGNDRIVFTNRTARQISGGDIAFLENSDAIGIDAAKKLCAMPAGGRTIVTLADGRMMLAWSARFSGVASGNRTLLSMQPVTGELDAIQLNAWQSMTRVLSHELMNSLTPVASLAESMADHADNPSQIVHSAGIIARRSRHLVDFVERYRLLVDLPVPLKTEIHLDRFLKDIASIAHQEPGSDVPDLVVESSPPNVCFYGDETLLSQAILNLIRNAADATRGQPNGQIEISCKTGRSEIEITVSDNGTGIEPEQMDEIFVPFFTTRPSGSGIGLSLARQIALTHSGRLIAERRPQGGMLFFLTLPKHL